MAKPYRKDIDFAFFVVHFGYSKADYEALTLREKAFIYKMWEEKMLQDSYNIYNAVFTATYNVNRPKGKQALKLWKKARVRRANMKVVQNTMDIIQNIEKKEGNLWINAVYKANGISMPEKGGDAIV